VKRNKVVVVIGCCSLLLLASCSQFASNGEKIYLRSKNGPGIVVPPPLTDNNISHFYDLPAKPSKQPEVGVEPPFIEPTNEPKS
jgi:uncharacterized lipoprotein